MPIGLACRTALEYVFSTFYFKCLWSYTVTISCVQATAHMLVTCTWSAPRTTQFCMRSLRCLGLLRSRGLIVAENMKNVRIMRQDHLV